MGSFRPLRGAFQPEEVKLLQAFDATLADIIHPQSIGPLYWV